MKISYNWLKTLIDIELAPEQLAEHLTACGLEVEGIEKYESVAGGLKGLVIGEVLEREKHPDADRLSLTKVNIGTGETLSIVCGASNVAAGQKVVIATIGAKLYPTNGEAFEIKKSKIRGALSEGMICAEDEIGLGHSHDGIMVLDTHAVVGTAAADYFKLKEDTVFEIGLTPNRSDAASHLGVARDLAAVLNCTTNTLHHKAEIKGANHLPAAAGTLKIDIEVAEPALCKRYSGLTITGITVKESPDWLKNYLKAIGLRPINNIVDITNYVLHELGQPLHAFDAAKIKGNKVIVRKALPNESFVTLDGVERKLNENDLMICNTEEAMTIAGVFGGLHSGVSSETTSIFLESAYFDAGSIRKSSKLHGLKTDASFRFERGTDPEMTVTALARAAHLVLELAGGQIASDSIDIYPEKSEPYKIAFSYTNCDNLIGKNIDHALIKNILISLGIEIVSEGADALLLSVPLYKTDVTREADVIEEVMRIYGYNNVEVAQQVKFAVAFSDKQDTSKIDTLIADVLVNTGFSEIMATSLTRETYFQNSELHPKESLVAILNPLSSDLNIMRPSLLYSGLEAIAYNINRKNNDLKLFEFGRTYHQANNNEFKYSEEKHLSLFLTGRKNAENAFGQNDKVTFYLLKGYLEQVLNRLGIKGYKLEETTSENYSYALNYFAGKKLLATISLLNKSVLKKCDISAEVFYADIHLNTIYKSINPDKLKHTEVSKFPAVRRDLALLLNQNIKYKELEELAFSTERKLLKEVSLFDIYEGDKLEKGKKSYALSFTLLDENATLTDKQVDAVMQKLIKIYEEKLGAVLRQ